MSTTSHQLPLRAHSPPKFHNYDLFARLCKISPILIEALTKFRLDRDHVSSLNILREAHSLTRPWLEETRRELRSRGLLDHSPRKRARSEKSKESWLLLVAKMVVMQWKLERQPTHADKHAWRMEMLKELFEHLEAHSGRIEKDIRRLERKLGQAPSIRRQHRHSRSSNNTNDRNISRDAETSRSADEQRSQRSRYQSPELENHHNARADTPQRPPYETDRPDHEEFRETTKTHEPYSQFSGPSHEQMPNGEIPVFDGAQRYARSAKPHRVASLVGSFVSKASSKLSDMNAEPAIPPGASPKGAHGVPGYEGLSAGAPYNHVRTATMPSGPHSVTSSEQSRQTRAPTISTVRSARAGNGDSPAPRQKDLPFRSKLSSAFSRVKSGLSHDPEPRRSSTRNAKQSRSTMSPQAEPALHQQPYPPSQSSSAHANRTSRTYVNSPNWSQSTLRPPASEHDYQPTDSIFNRTRDHAQQPHGRSASFKSVDSSRVPPPSGMSVHLGSPGHSAHSTYSVRSNRRPSSTSAQSRAPKESRADSVASDIDDEVSEVPYMGYVRPEPGRKKCHHEPPESGCASTTSSSASRME